MRKWRILFLSVFLFYGMTSKGQQGCTLQIKGHVYSSDGNPLQGVIITPQAGEQIVSDRRGAFRISQVCTGDLALEFRYIGYTSVTLTYRVFGDTTLRVTLQDDPIHIKDVEIMGEKSGSLSVNTHRLSVQQKQESKGENFAQSLSRIVGVSTLSNGAHIVKPVINGMHSNRILILNNGIRQEGQQWGAEHAPEIDPFLADRFQVIKGAQGVRYGADALGGVVVVSPEDINTERALSGRVDLTGQTNGRGGATHGRLEGLVSAFSGLAWRVEASGKKLGNYKTADYYLGNTGVQEFNYAGMLQYKRERDDLELYYSHFGTEMGIFQGAHVSTIEDIQARIANGRPFESYDFQYGINAPSQRVGHDLAKFSWKRRLTKGRSFSAQYGLQRNHRREYDMRRVESDDLPMADMVLTTHSLDFSVQNDKSTLGVQGMMQVNNNTPGTGTTPIIPNYDSYSFGLFGIHQFHIGRLHAEVGARYDYKYLDIAGYRYQRDNLQEGDLTQYLLTDSRTFHNVSGSIGILYHLSDKVNWKSNLGLAWRAPSVNELYSDGLHHGSATYEVGDKDLKSEKGIKWLNTLLWQSDRLRASLEVYGQFLSGYIYAQPDPDSVRQTIRGTFPLFSYQQHDAFFYGADFMASYDLSEVFRYELSASMVRAKNTELDSYLPYIPADRLSHGLRWQYATEQQVGSYLKLSHRAVRRQTRYQPETDYAAPPAGYHLFDVIASKQFITRQHRSLIVVASVNNLLNTSYKDYMDRFRYFAHQMGRNINIKFSFQF
ncbi:TonB-dependent receptor [Sphingobacterium sp. JB170]|uniref:TonB-dependent receptor n=1 Tax=Sphingobacterium sp. JB170 TaxID=1434842 RepID=UPI00097F1257|nr:TonB-dependent receptor [Sphingobacterium sp. JB170]SJN49360.1 hypothetical protein FM107_18545 [Sphingobacterium sp. JB170]